MNIRTDWQGVTLLAKSGLPSLRELTLCVHDRRGADPTTTLAFLRQLCVLTLVLPDSYGRLTGAHILSAVQSLSHLRELTIEGGGYQLKVAAFGDEHLLALTAAMPHLESLSLDYDCNVTPAAIRIAGENCRQWRMLALHQRVDLDELGRSLWAPTLSQVSLFPELRRLRLTSLTPSEPYWTRERSPGSSR
jgi:hypothetical protein